MNQGRTSFHHEPCASQSKRAFAGARWVVCMPLKINDYFARNPVRVVHHEDA